MQLYVQAWLLDKDGNRVKQNMAITIHHPEAMTDEKAEQLLESLKDGCCKMGKRLHAGKHRFCPRTKSGYENCRGRRNP